MSDAFRRITRSGSSSAVNELSDNNFSANLLTTINDFYKKQIFCDIVITNGSCRIKAHKIVLAANSQIFQIFLQKNQECSVFAVSDDFSKQSLEVLLSYMYTGVLVLRDPSQAVLLLQDALCLEISSVVTILQNYLKNHNLKLNKDQVGDRADFSKIGVAGIKVENKQRSRSSLTTSNKERAWKRILSDTNGNEATASNKKQKRGEIKTCQPNLRNCNLKLEMDSGKSCACDVCSENFKSHQALLYHKMHAHKMPSHLNSSKVASKALLKRSIIMKIKILLQKRSFCELTQAYNCPKCLMVFKSKPLFVCHTSLHLRSLFQDTTNFKQKNAKKLLNIAINSQNFTSEEKSLCTHCNVVLPNERLLMDHMITYHPNITFSCHHCPFSTRIQHVLERHQLENHRKRTTCPICGKSCARTESLNVHMLLIHKVHDSKIANKLHRCKEPGCGYVCLYKKRVEEHALKHKDTKQHKCNICSKMFKHEKGLQRHKLVIHDGVRPFICDICGQAYGQEGELKVHIARHSSNKPHACHLCPYTTQYKANLQSHLFKIHQVMMNQKMLVFSCDQCPYITTRRSRFNDHIKKTHKNIVDIPCPICNKMFSTKQNLYGHMTSVHKPKTFQCSYCSYSTGVSTTLKQHVKVMHTQRDVKNYECSLCGFRSATSGNCRKHIRRLHMNQQLDPKFVGPTSDNIQ